MALTLEWSRRIDNWRQELPQHFYRVLGPVPLRGYVTSEQLTPEEASRQDFVPMPAGTPWGAKWEYGWFSGKVVAPPESAGRRLVLHLETTGQSGFTIGESVIFVNGQAAGASDRQHSHLTLSMSATPGATYDILAESYAGHGLLVTSGGPVPPGRETVPEPPPTQAVVGASTYGIWEEDVYQLWLDVQTLYHVRSNIDPNTLRVAEIDQALRDFTTIVDFELPQDEFLATVRACRERLKPLLACVNGSTSPLMYCFGHAHIDLAWLWPWAETERKCGRTFSTQLALMAEYPEYKFLQSQAHAYVVARQRYPELYSRMVDAVRRGQFLPEGGMWVEADTNISGGESLIRQFIHGKRFFHDEFGVDCEMLWLPDVFGYSGAMPQIMRGCGIRYFATAKIFWAYNGGDPFPYNTFTWEGVDGSEVLVHLMNDYNSQTNAASVIERWDQRVQKDGFSTRLLPFGWGDGGGGPTRDHIEYLRRLANLEGVPRTTIASPIAYFKEQEALGVSERYVGELYFQAHRGTYTSQARTKRGNRKSELALREAEIWGAAASTLAAYAYPLARIDEAWKKVLLNQFHDIIPGSSIHRVYEEAEAAYESVIDTAEEIAGEAAGQMTDGSEAITVFNSLSWERSALVELPEDFAGAIDLDGASLPIQRVKDGALVEVTLPSCGWTTLRPAAPCDPTLAEHNTLKATPHLLENECLRLEFNEYGEIISLFDKETGRELATGACNSLKMYKDVPTAWDAWDIDSTYAANPVAMPEMAQITVVAEGPLVAKLRVKRQLHDSPMVQEISLRRGSRRVDFETEIDWRESHKLLKVAFPVDIHANEAIHEIQFGHIRRPNHRSRPFDADRFEVSNHKWTALAEENRGCAVLNDCKYGVNVVGETINLTLLKSAMAPDMTADKGKQVFAYAFYAWNGCFAGSALVREAYDLNCPIMTVSGAAGERSLFSLDMANVVIETVKPAEDGSGDIVVRLYESKRMATRCTLVTSLPVARAWLTNMLEETTGDLAIQDGRIALDLGALQILTLRLQMAR